MTKPSKKKPVVVAVSGGFDPIHIGHVRMFERAKALGDELVVILNNDNWLKKKKGFAFMPEKERKEVIEALRRGGPRGHQQTQPERSRYERLPRAARGEAGHLRERR